MKSNIESSPIQSASELIRQGRNYAYGFTRNTHDAEDLAQQAWLKLVQKYGEVTDRRLLYRAIRNLFIDGVRRAKIVQFDSLEDRDFAIGREQSFGANTDIDSLLSVLSDNERTYLKMNVVEGYTASEIAERTGVPRGTILSHTHRARKKLHKHFESEFNEVQEEEAELAVAV
ncbi:RNA polymerase sigma factor [Pelagicoccus sp. SDUM812002]|uniref:RNA polymerase sigma factor n=1 Tax=Pelagicoccus sp. SDUM812002 TaxID=3041266 RepID=UPI00280E8CD4|nr:RNA polymerase sigma factor [Pelagicoccus sp. SDUM812002]MDQ8186599.1 RNA polymerase sigma factor [Pelagicoccus sp. SDUM812002]